MYYPYWVTFKGNSNQSTSHCQQLKRLGFIQKVFVPGLNNGHVSSYLERKFLSLPTKPEGMGLVTFTDAAEI